MKLPTLLRHSGLDDPTHKGEYHPSLLPRRIRETQYHVGVGGELGLSPKIHTHELYTCAPC